MNQVIKNELTIQMWLPQWLATGRELKEGNILYESAGDAKRNANPYIFKKYADTTKKVLDCPEWKKSCTQHINNFFINVKVKIIDDNN